MNQVMIEEDVSQGVIYFDDGSYYEGPLVNNKPNGLGMICSIDGTKYIGSVKNGVRHGQGTTTFNDGTQFTGVYNRGDQVRATPGKGVFYPKELIEPRIKPKKMSKVMNSFQTANYYAYLTWRMLPPKLYDNPDLECQDCKVISVKIGRRRYYAGQFNGLKMQGRGTLMMTEKHQIREGYFNGASFMAISGRRIMAKDDGSVTVEVYDR